MKFEIKEKYPVLQCFLDKGESIVTTAGNMSWMTEHMSYNVSSGGGIKKAFGRAFSGEKFFQNVYTAEADNQELAFTISMPGEILHLELDNTKSYIAQKSAFLAAEVDVVFESVFTKKFSAGLLGGEGFILQRFTGNGNLFLECDGSLVEYDLTPGEVLLVDQGNLFMFEETVAYEIQTVKGLSNKLFGGEGFFLVKLKGPGKVWLQTLPVTRLAGELLRVAPQG